MELKRLRSSLQSFKWKPKTLTIKKEGDKLYLFFQLKRYAVSEKEGKVVLTARDGRERQAERLFYQNRQLT